MLFTSGEFLFVYLPIVLCAFFLIARFGSRLAAAAWLTIASLIFYGHWRAEHTVLLVASIAFNYVLGNLILGARTRGSTAARPLLIFAVVTNLAVLAYFKYANFFLSSVATAVGAPDWDAIDVLLPLGISFFTFTQIAYLVDVHAGKVSERNPVHYALFVTYFPHLIAGPVLHHAEMMPQFGQAENYRPHLRNLTIGLAFLTLGLAKKILVADSVAPLANDVFAQALQAPVTTLAAWLGVLAYTLQIYFDFSGYSDMAVGLSLLIGVRLPYNFNSPYRARNISEFWRRWHMTLSRFLRDYLYIPLGGNRRGKFRRWANLLITMLLGGLWHGASWTFVVWGGLHGLYLVIHQMWQRFWESGAAQRQPRSRAWSLAAHVSGVALTCLCVMVAWVFFRATSFDSAFSIVRSMFGMASAVAVDVAYEQRMLVWIVVFGLGALFVRNSQELIDGSMTTALGKLTVHRWHDRLLAALCGIMVVMIVFLAMIAASRSVSEFIYFNF